MYWYIDMDSYDYDSADNWFFLPIISTIDKYLLPCHEWLTTRIYIGTARILKTNNKINVISTRKNADHWEHNLIICRW